MNKINLNEVNVNSVNSIINFVVNSAPLEVKAAIKKYNGLNVDRYNNTQVAQLIKRWFDNGYNVSQFLNVRYTGQVVFPKGTSTGTVERFLKTISS